ncbi:MAG: DUF1624 domain-containing protein [Desulfitobacterium sp.]|nr:DUF1624 domain-containing protein [Desulfitobacterium sp.]
MKSRLWFVDFLRTLALCLMVLYHLIYDLDQWTNLNVQVNTPFWFVIGKTAALLFIFLSGFSYGLSKSTLKNSLKILFFASIITLVTYVLFPEQYIRFGILHFLGTMMLLFPIFKKIPTPILGLGALIVFTFSFIISDILVEGPWLLPLGFMYRGFVTMDYFPLIPYSGVTFLGIITFRLLEPKLKEKRSSLPHDQTQVKKLHSSVAWISSHSLLIYLIHQPILLSIIFILKKFTPKF